MNTKHTPGPWKSWEHRDSSGLQVGPPYSEPWMTKNDPDDAGFRVMDVCKIGGGGNRVTEIDRANARLIAAAPDLLEALKAYNALMDNLWKAVPWGKTFGLDIAALNLVPMRAKAAIAKAEGTPTEDPAQVQLPL